MPITQDRMIEILSAAKHAFDAVDGIHAEIIAMQSRAAQGKISWQEALEVLANTSVPSMILRPEARALIRFEREHFRRNKSRNDASRRWKERKRREEQGAPVRYQSQPKHQPPATAIYDHTHTDLGPLPDADEADNPNFALPDIDDDSLQPEPIPEPQITRAQRGLTDADRSIIEQLSAQYDAEHASRQPEPPDMTAAPDKTGE